MINSIQKAFENWIVNKNAKLVQSFYCRMISNTHEYKSIRRQKIDMRGVVSIASLDQTEHLLFPHKKEHSIV